jgi:hypothetical protein
MGIYKTISVRKQPKICFRIVTGMGLMIGLSLMIFYAGLSHSSRNMLNSPVVLF